MSASVLVSTSSTAGLHAVRAGAFGNATALVCRECGAEQPLGPFYACDECFGPLEIGYDFPSVTREQIEAGPKNIWRYQPLLPVPPTSPRAATWSPASPGWSPPPTSAASSAIKSLWVKDDSGNPTHSFKDRVVAMALSAARELGAKVFACPSTGNLANAVAAAGARAGIRTVVFIPHDLEPAKIQMTAVYGGSLVAVRGSYDDVNRLASEIAGEEEGWAFVNVNVRPYYAEGSKTLAFEIAEQLGWRIPEQVVVPVASGSQLTKIDKGFQELIALGLVEDTPYRIFGAQAEGCSPVSAAFKAGHDVVRPVKPDTIAKSLAIGNPADGPYVLDVTRRTGGAVEDVTDDAGPRRHPAARPHRGHLRRDRRRRDRRGDEEARGDRSARPRPGDRRPQHRRRAEDPGRGGRTGSRPRRRSTRRTPSSWPPAWPDRADRPA